MYIEPSTIIKIYNSIPLDNSYNNTLWFENRTAQNEYFHNGTRQKYTLTAQSYQRVEKGRMRIQLKSDLLYDCNYLAFQNSNFGNKWFYAFITGVEYINNETSEISFDIDIMQTYFLDVTLKECFVERQHSITDNVGDNIQPEPVELGEYVTEGLHVLDNNVDHLSFNLDEDSPSRFGWNMLTVVISPKHDDEGYTASYIDGQYSGCTFRVFDIGAMSNITAWIHAFASSDQIVAVYQIPELLSPVHPQDDTWIPHPTYLNNREAVKYIFRLPSVINQGTNFGNYNEIKNKKMYTYPYNYLRVDNGNGQSLNLRYEMFGLNRPLLEITGAVSPPAKVVLRPTNYKGFSGDVTLNPNGIYQHCTSESLTLEDFPMCSWNSNTFKEWAIQNWFPSATNIISDGIAGATRTFTGRTPIQQTSAGLTTALSLVGDVTNVINGAYAASIIGSECRGNTSNSNVDVAYWRHYFSYTRCHVAEDYAKTIDNFFTMFGYAQNKVMTPNVHARQVYTYVKTKGCNMIGNAPADEIARMKSIFDNGITFWAVPHAVGDYSGSNPIIAQGGDDNE